MSRDDEIAVKYHDGKWYVAHIFAQRTEDIVENGEVFDKRGDALEYAHKIDRGTEYGVSLYEPRKWSQ